jgi:hypothetical protein
MLSHPTKYQPIQVQELFSQIEKVKIYFNSQLFNVVNQ